MVNLYSHFLEFSEDPTAYPGITRFLGEGKGWLSSLIARGRFEGIEMDGTTLANAADAADVADAARY